MGIPPLGMPPGIFSSSSSHARLHAAGRAALDGVPSSCHADALTNLDLRCGASMDEDARSRLAIHLTNCHMRASNLTWYPCSDDATIADCTRPMVDSPSAIAFRVYTTFVAHADSLCFFLRSEAFERRAASAVDALYGSSRDATERLHALTDEAAGLVAAAAARSRAAAAFT